MSLTLYAGQYDHDEHAAAWEAKVVLAINIVFSLLCLVLLHVMVRILERGRGYRKPYTALLLSILFALANHIILALLWNISDPINYKLSRLIMICAADTISWLTDVCMLAAITLVLWNRQHSYEGIGRGFGVMKRGFDSILLMTLLVIGALVLPVISGMIINKAEDESLTIKEYTDWQNKILILRGRVGLALLTAVIIDILATAFILRSRIRRLGNDDKPTNTVAVRLVPLLIARCAYELFAEFYWTKVAFDFTNKEYHSIPEAEAYIHKSLTLYLVGSLERSLTLGAIYVTLIIVGRTTRRWSRPENSLNAAHSFSYEAAREQYERLQTHGTSRSSDSLNSTQKV